MAQTQPVPPSRTIAAKARPNQLAVRYTVQTPTFALVHSSPNHPENFTYPDDLYEAEEAFAAGDDVIAFIRHWNLPGIFMLKPDDHIQQIPIAGYRVLHASGLIEQVTRFIINVGSTGQLRDNDFRPSYVLYDDIERTISWRRVQYEVAAAQARIRATSLPKNCAGRLEKRALTDRAARGPLRLQATSLIRQPAVLTNTSRRLLSNCFVCFYVFALSWMCL